MTVLLVLAATLLGLILLKLVTGALLGSTADAGAKLHAAACTRDLETAIAFHRANDAALLRADAARRAS